MFEGNREQNSGHSVEKLKISFNKIRNTFDQADSGLRFWAKFSFCYIIFSAPELGPPKICSMGRHLLGNSWIRP